MKSVALPYRTKLMQKAARSLKMDFSLLDEDGVDDYLKDFDLHKRLGIVNNVLKDEVLGEYALRIFDYHYTRYAPYDSVTTVFFMNCKKLDLPNFLMQPENFFHQISEILGVKDIDFEEAQSFSDHYFLTGEDEIRIRKSFNKKLLRIFTLKKGYTLEGVNYFLVFYQLHQALNFGQLKSFHNKGLRIYNTLVTVK